MSFSSSAKEDLVKIRLKTDHTRLAQLAGLIHTCGALTIGHGRGAVFTSETLAVGKHIVSLADALYTLEPVIELSERERRRPLTLVTLTGDDARKAARRHRHFIRGAGRLPPRRNRAGNAVDSG